MIKLLLLSLVLCQVALYSSHIEKDVSSYGFRKISHSPEIYECDCFLTDAECDSIIEEARPKLTRSTVIDNHSSKELLDTRRTSLGTFLSNIPLVKSGRIPLDTCVIWS